MIEEWEKPLVTAWLSENFGEDEITGVCKSNIKDPRAFEFVNLLIQFWFEAQTPRFWKIIDDVAIVALRPDKKTVAVLCASDVD